MTYMNLIEPPKKIKCLHFLSFRAQSKFWKLQTWPKCNEMEKNVKQDYKEQGKDEFKKTIESVPGKRGKVLVPWFSQINWKRTPTKLTFSTKKRKNPQKIAENNGRVDPPSLIPFRSWKRFQTLTGTIQPLMSCWQQRILAVMANCKWRTKFSVPGKGAGSWG